MCLSKRITFRTEQKDAWELYCSQNGVTSSEALRLVIQKILTGKTSFHEALNIPKRIITQKNDNKDKKRVEISLDQQDYDLAINHAKKAGFSLSKWLITLIRYQFIKHTPLTAIELDKLEERLYQIRMLGHNLNQLLRMLNNHELHPSQADIMPMLQQLMSNMDAEKKALNIIFQNNLHRW